MLRQTIERPTEFVRIAHRFVLLPLDVDGTIKLFETGLCFLHRFFAASSYESFANNRNVRPSLLPGGSPRLAEKAHLALQLFDGGMRPNDPSISYSRSSLDGCVGVRGDPYRWARLLQRLWIDAHIFNLEFLAFIGNMIFCPEPFYDLDT